MVQNDYVFNERYGGWNKGDANVSYFYKISDRHSKDTHLKHQAEIAQQNIDQKTKSKQNG